MADSTSLTPAETDTELSRYLFHLQLVDSGSAAKAASWMEEFKTTPLFTWDVKTFASTELSSSDSEDSEDSNNAITFEQFAVIGHELRSSNRPNAVVDTPIFLNTNAPWSAFICGSQGSGKSYTLSCMLENCLLPSELVGQTPKPLAGLLFHYDPHGSEAICEAAYLATHIPVKVLVSPSNYHRMVKLYSNVPGLEGKIRVVSLMLKEKHLNTQRMLRLMAFSEKDGAVPLYMETILRILKDMAVKAGGISSFNYNEFIRRVDNDMKEGTAGQKGPMKMRLQLLESFMDTGPLAPWLPRINTDLFDTSPGHLTIVDLTDPFVDPGSACVLFDIALSLFLDSNKAVGKVVALDEAHKFMTDTAASTTFTDSLLTLIREQRHKATRTIIATQEPTISPKLLDLCSMTFVHRFTSPEWLATLKAHLAVGEAGTARRLFEQIVVLDVGEALLFAPAAMLDVVKGAGIEKLGVLPVKFRTRKRVTKDGGRSVLAAGRVVAGGIGIGDGT